MKKGKIYLLMTALAAIIIFGAGCSEDDHPGEENSTGELKITATIAGISSDVSTRSVVTGESFSNNSTIGIFVDGDGYTSTAATY
ncbi:MAG: hypothetical protein AB7D05_00655, partial [Mangrovibacterium sp.]